MHRLRLFIDGKQKFLHAPDLAGDRKGALHIGFGQQDASLCRLLEKPHLFEHLSAKGFRAEANRRERIHVGSLPDHRHRFHRPAVL